MMSENDIELLIKLVEERRPLYDSDMKDHNNRVVFSRLWAEVAHELNKPVAECRAKWSSLRNYYARALREGKIARDGSMEHCHKKWYLADRMQFLTNYMHPHNNSLIDTGWEEAEVTDVQDLLKPGLTVTFDPNLSSILSKKLPEGSILMDTTEVQIQDLECQELAFFKSLIPDVQSLTNRRKRKFKEDVLSMLNSFLDDEEAEQNQTTSYQEIA